ncbi:MAG: hypothetical protein KBA95_13785, partial [Acidobacteria bacterium]|nr:hypothetical protein [Acidobacteriota bacterium]
LEAVQAAAGAELLESATAEAEADLGDFRTRMAAAEYARARDAAVRALLRDRCRLPVIAY